MAILVNGNGNARVYAAQDADLIASITGNTTVRTSVGNKMAATAADASTISVADGVILTKEGRRIQLDAGQTDLFTIPTGSVGVTNYYIIGYKLTTDSDNVQVAETFVQLMASSTDTIPEGTFRGGDSEVYVSVARVEQDGINLGTITALLPELETISELNNDLTAEDDLVFNFSKSGTEYGYKDSSNNFIPFSGLTETNYTLTSSKGTVTGKCTKIGHQVVLKCTFVGTAAVNDYIVSGMPSIGSGYFKCLAYDNTNDASMYLDGSGIYTKQALTNASINITIAYCVND